MLKTFIVEDDAEQLSTLKTTVTNHIMINDFDMQLVLATGVAQDVVDYLHANPDTTGLYFLDIEYPGQHLNGIELASQIRELDLNAKIVFVSTHAEMAFLTFERRIEPLDFIVKDLGDQAIKSKVEKDIRVAYDRYSQQGAASPEMFSYTKGAQLFNVPLQDVYYIETGDVRNKLVMHLKDRIIQYNGKISEETVKHPELFRAHKSFLINVANLTRIDKKQLLAYFPNEETVDIATRKLHALISAFKNQQGKK